VTSTIFLACYLTRVYLTGTHRYPGTGLMKAVYLAILLTHTILAMVTVPLVLRSLFLARRARFAEHRRIARYSLPVWLYVSVTGVVVYLMLYQLA
jgi:putative membrane protein